MQTYMGVTVQAPTGTYKGKRSKRELQEVAQRHHPNTALKAKRLANNTIELELPSSSGPIRIIQFQDTEIITFRPDGSIRLDSGGWQTVTTKARMNEYLPNGWGIWSDRGWFVHTPGEAEAVPFFDGIAFDKGGKLTKDSAKRVWSVAKHREADKKLIARAIKSYKSKGIPHDPSGDPWTFPDERGLFQASVVRDWLRTDYITQRLVLQALRWGNARDPGFRLLMGPGYNHPVLRRFLKACLGVGA